MNEADIPIDIHTLKLQEWLVSRRIVAKNIQTQNKDIRNKISNAIKDMPANDQLIKLLSGTHINYFHCKEIIEILKQTEKDTKSVFGNYGSQRMKDWQEIIKLYEKENVYLGESAQILVRNLNYEIPGIKKQIAKCEQQSNEALNKIQDISKTENVLLSQHASLCQQLGIKGENLREEITLKLSELPRIYDDSVTGIENLNEAVDMYADFSKNPNCLPITRHLSKCGNTTVYQYIHKEAPLSIEENAIRINIVEDSKPTETNEIDFGDDDDENAGGVISSDEVIDFSTLSSEVELECGEIDWGNENEPGESIDNDVPLQEYAIVVEESGMDGGIARGDQAYTVLDSPHYRDKFIDELYELDSFLKMRVFELMQTELSGNIMLSLMDISSTHDIKSINKMLKNLDGILAKVLSEQTQQLFQLKHSPKYANIFSNKLKQKLSAVEKIIKNKELLKVRSNECCEQKNQLQPVLHDLIEHTKLLQMQIENDISKRYKNRTVNLMGGVSSL